MSPIPLPSNKKKLFIFIAFLLLLLFFCFSDYGFIKRIELELQTSTLNKEITQQQLITDSIQNIIDKLLYDDYEIERIARQEYGMVKPNEDVYHIKK